jgi:hypothetical protein
MNTTVNLYDKWVKTEWHQLWADDSKAFILRPNRVANHYYDVLVDDGNETTEYELLNFSDGLDKWNSEINQYLTTKGSK